MEKLAAPMMTQSMEQGRNWELEIPRCAWDDRAFGGHEGRSGDPPVGINLKFDMGESPLLLT